jgi:hypothetical protein
MRCPRPSFIIFHQVLPESLLDSIRIHIMFEKLGSIFSSPSNASSSKRSKRAPSRASTYSGNSNKHRELVRYVGPPRSSTSRSQGGGSGASTRRPLSAYSERPDGDQSDGGYQSDGNATALERRGFFDENAPRDYFNNDDVKEHWDSLHPPKPEPPRAPRDTYRQPRYAATADRGECDAVTTAPSGVSTVHPRRYSELAKAQSKSVDYEGGVVDDLESVAPKDSISQVSTNPRNLTHPRPTGVQRHPNTEDDLRARRHRAARLGHIPHLRSKALSLAQ